MKAAVRGSGNSISFREHLRAELAARCTRNPQYSLRAFANYLGVHHSTLSQMLRGKRTITREAVEKFGFRLGLSEADVARFADAESSRTKPHGHEQEITALARDTAEVLEDWRNFAILELTRLTGFQADSRWIARMLGITVDEVNIAVSRLCRLRLLEMMPDGTWKDRLGDVMIDAGNFSELAVRNLADQVNHMGPHAGHHTTATVAIPARLAAAAEKRLEAFRHDLLQWLDAEAEKDEVYTLEIRFVPVTRRES